MDDTNKIAERMAELYTDNQIPDEKLYRETLALVIKDRVEELTPEMYEDLNKDWLAQKKTGVNIESYLLSRFAEIFVRQRVDDEVIQMTRLLTGVLNEKKSKKKIVRG